MDTFLHTIDQSQWILCCVQLTGLILIGCILGRITLYRFPDVSASIGVTILAASAGLILLTFAGVPRPFQLKGAAPQIVEVPTQSDSPISNADVSHTAMKPNTNALSWFERLVSLVDFSSTSMTSTNLTESKWRSITIDHFVGLLVFLTLLGGVVGIVRVAHSSKAIAALAKNSSPIEDQHLCFEVVRIVSRLPLSRGLGNISVHRFDDSGSPFVSWLTGNKIFVPESFLTWTASERLTGLAHEISHLQRRDHFCRVITQLAICLMWLHPLAWLMHRQTVLAQELAADQLAALTSDNPSAYCRGLSRLALRFDAQCRHPAALGVSVSSSLIRRITMLREITFHRLPCSRLVNRCIALTALITSTWIACWSVEGQVTTQEKRVDRGLLGT